ncbi:MAG: hypothetical protein H7123_04155, partial [Thermoleophilia bacterium]|nr:hypothetical protein [Thermoleophilia bacterium]
MKPSISFRGPRGLAALKQARKMMGNQLLVVEDEQHAAQRKVLAFEVAPDATRLFAAYLFAVLRYIATVDRAYVRA